MRPFRALVLVFAGCMLACCDRSSSLQSSSPSADQSSPAVTTWLEGVPDSVQLLADQPACDCTITMRRELTIADADGRAGLSSPVAIARISDGRYMVVPSVDPSALLVFDRRGRFQERVGRRGQGPGEFSSIRALETMRGDSVLVLDFGTRRMTVLGPDLQYARSVTPPVTGGWIGPLADGRLAVLGGIAPSDEAPTDRLAVLDPELATITSSFLPQESGPTASGFSARRRMSATAEGTVVVAHNARYLVELWHIEGRRLKSLARAPDWFPLGMDEQELADAGTPLLEIAKLDDDGILWTVIHRDDEDAQPAPSPGAQPPIVITVQPSSGAPTPRGSVVEAIDPDDEMLLATLPVDRPVLFLLQNRLAVTYREDEAGQPFIDVWELELDR